MKSFLLIKSCVFLETIGSLILTTKVALFFPCLSFVVDCLSNLYIYINVYPLKEPSGLTLLGNILAVYGSTTYFFLAFHTKVPKNPRVSARMSSHMQSPMVLGKVVEARHNKTWVVAMFIASSSISQVFNLDARPGGVNLQVKMSTRPTA